MGPNVADKLTPDVTPEPKAPSNDAVISIALEPTAAHGVDEDGVLIERFVRGERAAFDRLYRLYYDKVYSIARNILLNSDEAQDATQEVFTLVFRNLHRFDRRSRFSTWLFRIAVNRSIQQARRTKNRHRETELHDAATLEAPIQMDTPDPRIRHVLRMLSPQDRAILTLFYWEELNLQEIADGLGCTPNAAKTRLYRARERFKALYEGTNE